MSIAAVKMGRKTSMSTAALEEISSSASMTNQCYYEFVNQAVAPPRNRSQSQPVGDISHRRAGSAPEVDVGPTALLAETSRDDVSVSTADVGSITESVQDSTVPAVTSPPVLEHGSQTCRILQLKPETRYTLVLEACVDCGKAISTVNFMTAVVNKVRSV